MPKKAYKKKPKANAAKTKKVVKSVINRMIETKQYYYTYNAGNVSSTVGTQLVIWPKRGNAQVTGADIERTPGYQGVGGYQMIGNKILVKSVNINFRIQNNTTLQTASLCRILVVLDTKAQGLSVTTSELLSDVGAGLGVLSPRKYNSKPTYKILHDQLVKLHPRGGSALTVGSQCWDTYGFKWSKYWSDGIPVTYYPDTAQSGSLTVQDNNLVCILIADGAGVAYSVANASVLYKDA